jgi:NADH-quinone oxidoreductase subunit L
VAPSIPEASGVTLAFSVIAALALAVAGIWVAYNLYGRPSEKPAELRRRYPGAARAAEQKFYFDEAYDVAFYEPADRTAVGLTRFVESPLVLRSLGGLGGGVRSLSDRVADAQTGRVRSYVLAVAGGLAILAVVFALVA